MIAVLVVSRKHKPVTGRHDDGAAERVELIPGIEELWEIVVRPLINPWVRIGWNPSENY
jgi:hypothetical protein